MQTIENALWEIVDFEDDEEEGGEDVLADMIILQKNAWSYCYHEICSL